MRKVLKAATVTVLLLAVCLAAVEAVLRWSGFVPDGFYIPRYYVGVPGDLEPHLTMYEALYPERKYIITSTPQGTRGLKPFSPQKPSGSLRVLCLGDSYTFSSGVADKDAYPEQLAQELELRHPGMKIDVVNAGIPMFGLLDEIDYYLEKGRFLRPDVVVLQFYANDFQDHLRGIVLREAARSLLDTSKRSIVSRCFWWSKIYQ